MNRSLLLVVALGSAEFLPPDGEAWVRILASNEARFGGAAGQELRGPGAVLWRKVARESKAA